MKLSGMFFQISDDFELVVIDFGEDSEVPGALEEGVVVGEEEDRLRENHVPVSGPSQAQMLEENQEHLEKQEEPREQRNVSEKKLEEE